MAFFPSTAKSDDQFAISAVQDSFCRQAAATSNYGGAGLLCAAGPDSVNGLGQARGQFDSLLTFDLSPAVNAFDTAFDVGGWTVTGLALRLTQVAAPENNLFPRGTGQFEVAWISDDGWTEGTGTPNSPMPGTGNIITWQFLQDMLTNASRTPLGVGTNAGVSGEHEFALAPTTGFLADMAATGIVTLHVKALSPALGFTFHSRNFGEVEARPMLILTAAAKGDCDGDGDVDTSDFASWPACVQGPVAGAALECLCADMDGDGAVDLFDFAFFQDLAATP